MNKSTILIKNGRLYGAPEDMYFEILEVLENDYRSDIECIYHIRNWWMEEYYVTVMNYKSGQEWFIKSDLTSGVTLDHGYMGQLEIMKGDLVDVC